MRRRANECYRHSHAICALHSLDEINPVAHPIMGGKLEVLQKINNYLQLMKLAKTTSPPHPQYSHARLNLLCLELELKRLYIALYCIYMNVTKITTL